MCKKNSKLVLTNVLLRLRRLILLPKNLEKLMNLKESTKLRRPKSYKCCINCISEDIGTQHTGSLSAGAGDG